MEVTCENCDFDCQNCEYNLPDSYDYVMQIPVERFGHMTVTEPVNIIYDYTAMNENRYRSDE